MPSTKLTLVSPEEEPQRPDNSHARRPARALTGWMQPEAAHAILQADSTDPNTAAAAIATAERARRVVAARPAGVDQDGLVMPAPAGLDRHIRELRASPAAAPYFSEGWRVALVDLSRVVACQPHVLTDQVTDRVAAIDPDDPASVAALTLPTGQGEPVPVQYDPQRMVLTVVSSSHNLRIVAPFAPIQQLPGEASSPAPLGFVVVDAPSFMQIACVGGRHYMRDGHHRALALLARGITTVPAFVREPTAFEEIFDPRAQLLPRDAYIGSRPPIMQDLLDDSVSTPVQVPDIKKVIAISFVEFPLAS